ncbi:helix-turn-helix domain-containing protein [Streptomyces sp. NPDC048258]|uniref:helix-turn-helix domain-containing protein n=1 Tax=Streptomyces sp. NPDC048258 TaxID=3365527 RepID=UPI003714EA2E
MSTLSPARLRAARAQVGLTQRQLAARCGMTATAVCNWETGRVSPAPRVIGLLALALDLSIPDLCEPEDDELFALLDELNESRRRRALDHLHRAVAAPSLGAC